MNEIKNYIADYRETGSEASFEIIYAHVTQSIIGLTNGNSYFRQVARSLKADVADVKAAFDDTVLYTVSKYDGNIDFLHYFKWCWKNRRANLYKKVKRIRDNEFYEGVAADEDESLDLFANIADETTVEQTVFKTKEADQRQLIDSLVCGEKERTTAIVQAFLIHPKPNATAIANELGLDHKQVSRALHRLAAKFNPKQFGSHRDYLVAL